MEQQNLKCRKCGASVSAEQKKCPKCGAPILLKVMQEEEKRHLSAKEIRDKDKRMRREYDKINKEKEKERQKEEKQRQKNELNQQTAEAEKNDEMELKAKEAEAARKAEEAEELKEQAKKETVERHEVPTPTPYQNKKKSGMPLIIKLIIIVAVIGLLIAGISEIMSNYVRTDETVAPVDDNAIVEEQPQEEQPAEQPIEQPAEQPQEEAVEEPQEQPQAEQQAEESQEQPQAEQPAEQPQEQPAETEKPKEEKKAAPQAKRNITKNNYLFPSDTQRLRYSDLIGLSKYDTGLIRNEIYARKGYVFKKEPYKSYFNSQAWYTPNAKAKITLNETEKYNVDFLLEFEREQGWR